MQIPYRKPGKYTNIPNDPIMTIYKFAELKKKLDKLKQKQHFASSEVSRLSELGDFSENAEYQQAKGRLRGILDAITKLEFQLNQAEIIKPNDSEIVQIGNTVTIKINDVKKIYTILGSSETNPTKNIISYTSPIGQALLGNKIGSSINMQLKGKPIVLKILGIS